MLLQDTVLRDGSTRTARVWTYVAGQNILGSPNILRNSKQTSAARLNTPHKRAHTEQQHTSRGGTAVEDNLTRTHELDTEQSSFSCVVRNTPGLPTHAHRALAGTAPHCQKLCRTDETSGLQAGARHDSHLRKHVPAQRVLEEQIPLRTGQDSEFV